MAHRRGHVSRSPPPPAGRRPCRSAASGPAAASTPAVAALALGAGILAGIAWITEAPGFGSAPGGWLTFLGRLTGLDRHLHRPGQHRALGPPPLGRAPAGPRPVGLRAPQARHHDPHAADRARGAHHRRLRRRLGHEPARRGVDDRHDVPRDAQGHGRVPALPHGRRARHPARPPRHALRDLVGAPPRDLPRRDPRLGPPAGHRSGVPGPPVPELRVDLHDVRRRRARRLRPRAHPRRSGRLGTRCACTASCSRHPAWSASTSPATTSRPWTCTAASTCCGGSSPPTCGGVRTRTRCPADPTATSCASRCARWASTAPRSSTSRPGPGSSSKGRTGASTSRSTVSWPTSRCCSWPAGSGIAPVRAILEEQGPRRGTVVLYRVRSQDDVLFRDEFERMVASFGATVYVLSGHRHEQPITADAHPPAGPGRRPAHDLHVRAGGPDHMPSGPRRTTSGIPQDRVHAESFAFLPA